jgi:hypothetical protein
MVIVTINAFGRAGKPGTGLVHALSGADEPCCHRRRVVRLVEGPRAGCRDADLRVDVGKAVGEGQLRLAADSAVILGKVVTVLRRLLLRRQRRRPTRAVMASRFSSAEANGTGREQARQPARTRAIGKLSVSRSRETPDAILRRWLTARCARPGKGPELRPQGQGLGGTAW